MEASVEIPFDPSSGRLVAPPRLADPSCLGLCREILKGRELDDVKHTQPLPDLIILDSSISVGFEIYLLISVVGTKRHGYCKVPKLKLAKNSIKSIFPDSMGCFLMKCSVPLL